MSGPPTPKLTAETLSGEIDLRRERVADAAATFPERRRKPRVRQPFSTIVTGTDAEGRFFELKTELSDMSSSGLYLRLPQDVPIGSPLNFRISFNNGAATGATASVIGRVLRVERGSNGLNGFGCAITEYEFI